MLLLSFSGFAGLVILGVLLICVGLSGGLDANNATSIEESHRPRLCVAGRSAPGRRSALHSAIRFATVTDRDLGPG